MAEKRWSPEEIAAAAAALEGQGPEAALRWAYEQFAHDEIAFACSFGAEDVALAHMISRVAPGAQVFYLDTNFLFPETYRDHRGRAGRLPPAHPAGAAAAHARGAGGAVRRRTVAPETRTSAAPAQGGAPDRRC